LPYADRLTLDIVPDQNTELLRFDGGALDLLVATVRPEDYAAFRRLAAEGKARLHDMGVALDADFLWFNLSSAAMKGTDRPWLHDTVLRQAISHAVDRAAIADTVFLGMGVPVHGPVTPGNKVWYSPDIRTYEYDVAKAKTLLRSIALEDRDGDGIAEDAAGRPARFSLLTQKGTSIRERTAAVIQQQLKAVGLAVDVVPLDVGSLIDRLNRGDFEAIYFGVNNSDTDPAGAVEFWLSSGSFNPWNTADKTPASDWERTIDELIRQQMTSNDLEERRRLFAQAQRVFSEHLPAIYFIAPRVTVATSSRVLNVQPSLLRPHVLWAADTLAVRH
jgi:peptide/nickel transport system substrate-binding protein